jgi:hypothetical protein
MRSSAWSHEILVNSPLPLVPAAALDTTVAPVSACTAGSWRPCYTRRRGYTHAPDRRGGSLTGRASR